MHHAGRSFRIRDIRGLGMLAKLVESPERELHVLDLAADALPPGAAMDLGDSGEVLDAKARDAYKARIVDLREQVQEAESFADTARA